MTIQNIYFNFFQLLYTFNFQTFFIYHYENVRNNG